MSYRQKYSLWSLIPCFLIHLLLKSLILSLPISIAIILIAGAIGYLLDEDEAKIIAQREYEKQKVRNEQAKQKKEQEREIQLKAKIMAENEVKRQKLSESLEKYLLVINSIISKHDKDEDGEIDLIPNTDFSQLLKKHQSKIVEIDKSYIQKFVQISNFLNFKKKNISELFGQLYTYKERCLIDISEKNFSYYSYHTSDHPTIRVQQIDYIIKIEIHTYESVIFHSISMITSLLTNDLITFYEIFESLDKLGIFNTNWEKEISAKLSNIMDKFDELIDSIKQLEYQINNSLDSLSYTTESSFRELNKSVSGQLSEIGSSLEFNNLLTGIQIYQNHKLNKNLKRLN